MTLAEKIQKLRQEAGLSQEQLAEQLEVSRQAVGKWESGQSRPDMDKLIALAGRFGVSTDYLLKGETAKPAKRGWLPAALAAGLIVSLAGAAWLGVAAARAATERAALAEETAGLEADGAALEAELQTSRTALEEAQAALEEARSQPPERLEAWDDYFYRFGRTYRLDYMPAFPAGNAPGESTAYLFWAFTINLDNWGEEKGTMSRTYVEEAVANHFGVTSLVHLPMVKGWNYDGEVYTAYPGGVNPLPVYRVSSWRIFEEDGRLLYEVILDQYHHKEGMLLDPAGLETLEEVWAEYGLENLEVAQREKVVYYWRSHQEIPVFVSHEILPLEP